VNAAATGGTYGESGDAVFKPIELMSAGRAATSALRILLTCPLVKLFLHASEE
jgi:hypothetical protein